ncbi:MAG: PIG-L family deacetylase [bacterium]
MSSLNIESNDRILVLAPHPDDEVIGCGGVIQRAIATGATVRIVFLTCGDSNELSFLLHRKHPVFTPSAVRRMGMIRSAEALAAGAALGLDRGSITLLGYPDFGVMEIWYSHWGHCASLRSILTKADRVPYDSAYRPGALHKGDAVLKDITSIISDYRPTKIFVSHSADRNSDHRALYLFTQVALWNLERELRPAVYPYLVHYKTWPLKKGYCPDEPMTSPAHLSDRVSWTRLTLQPLEVARKRSAILMHATQCRYSSRFLLSFARSCELFGDYPRIVLPANSPPQEGKNGCSRRAGSWSTADALTEAERSRLIGTQWQTVDWDGKHLTISANLSRPLAGALSFSLYIFGYRSNRAFARMPKLHIHIHPMKYEVLDQKRQLSRTVISLVRTKCGVEVRVSAAVMGSPQRIMMRVSTHLADVRLNSAPWRILELQPPESDPAEG